MKTRAIFGLAVCLLAPTLTGCIQYPCAVRGQSPDACPTCGPDGGHFGGHGAYGDPYGGYQPRFSDRIGYYGQHLGGVIPQHDHIGHYTVDGNHDYRGPGWYPKHHHFYSYRREDDLVYPPAQTPGAIVQYPYYTHRGPTDFFMQ